MSDVDVAVPTAFHTALRRAGTWKHVADRLVTALADGLDVRHRSPVTRVLLDTFDDAQLEAVALFLDRTAELALHHAALPRSPLAEAEAEGAHEPSRPALHRTGPHRPRIHQVAAEARAGSGRRWTISYEPLHGSADFGRLGHCTFHARPPLRHLLLRKVLTAHVELFGRRDGLTVRWNRTARGHTGGVRRGRTTVAPAGTRAGRDSCRRGCPWGCCS